MFVFKKGCTFELNGVEVTVPANFCINGEPTDFSEDWLTFMPLRQNYIVRYEMNYDSIGTKEELCGLIYDEYTHDDPLGRIEEIENNGLFGHQGTYIGTRWQIYEARFTVEDTDEGNIEFVVMIKTKNCDIEEIKASAEFKQIFQGVRRI